MLGVISVDRVGNDRADEAADFGRPRVELGVSMLGGTFLVYAGVGIP